MSLPDLVFLLKSKVHVAGKNGSIEYLRLSRFKLYSQFTNKAYKRLTCYSAIHFTGKSPQIIFVQFRENRKLKYALTFDVIC